MLTIFGVVLVGAAIVVTLSFILACFEKDDAAFILAMAYILLSTVTLMGAVGGDLVGWWDVGLD